MNASGPGGSLFGLSRFRGLRLSVNWKLMSDPAGVLISAFPALNAVFRVFGFSRFRDEWGEDLILQRRRDVCARLSLAEGEAMSRSSHRLPAGDLGPRRGRET